jgi:four helix bundle protein
MRKFQCYQLAVNLYQQTKTVRLPAHLKNQYQRACSSIALNLAEGWGKGISADRKRFWKIALGSIRECESITALEPQAFGTRQLALLNHLAASTYRLIERAPTTYP